MMKHTMNRSTAFNNGASYQHHHTCNLDEKTFERSLKPSQALSLLQELSTDFHLSPTTEIFGETVPIYKCYLKAGRHENIFIAGGKGFGQQCQVSAIYEALQHFIAYQSIQDKNHPIHYMALNEIKDKDYLLSCNFLPEVIIKTPDRKLPWLTYQSYTDTQVIHYPLPLVEVRLNLLPAFNEYSDLTWRGHDTGSAIGCSFFEASIHGINEWIERDAYALFLVKSILKKSINPINVIDKHSLPPRLNELVKNIEVDYQDDLIIVDITSDINVPSFLVSFTKQNSLMQAKGLGTSLSKSYAIERAIFEALQSRCLRNTNTEILEEKISADFESAPLLLRAAKCDLLPLIEEGAYRVVHYENIIDYSDISDLSSQLDCLNRLLHTRGLKAFYHQYYSNENGITSLGVLIPGLEEFFLVKCGRFIMPNARAANIIRNRGG
jgi:ribosomal protein S12 methylthiotransferase accessory factor